MKVVLNYYETNRSDRDATLKELQRFLFSYKLFKNELPITILSNSKEFFKDVEDMCGLENITLQIVDYDLFFEKWKCLPSGEDWLRESFTKLFLNEIIQGDFLYFDMDILFFNKIDPYLVQPQPSKYILSPAMWVDQESDWSVSGVLKFSNLTKFSNVHCRHVSRFDDLKMLNKSDEVFYTYSQRVIGCRELTESKVYDYYLMGSRDVGDILQKMQHSYYTGDPCSEVMCYHYFEEKRGLFREGTETFFKSICSGKGDVDIC